MRRILPILAMAALTTALFTSPVLAKHVNPNGGGGASCTVTPSSAPAGSAFTAVCTGFPHNVVANENCGQFPQGSGIQITWFVESSTQTFWSSRYCVSTDSQGGFTTSQIVPIPSEPNNFAGMDAQVNTSATKLIDAHTFFTVTP